MQQRCEKKKTETVEEPRGSDKKGKKSNRRAGDFAISAREKENTRYAADGGTGQRVIGKVRTGETEELGIFHRLMKAERRFRE